MRKEEIVILEEYCLLSEQISTLEKRRKELREKIDAMRLPADFSLSVENGVLAMRKGNRKLLIVDGLALIRELGNKFFADNVNIPISKLEETFRDGIVDELLAKRMVEVEYGKPVLQYKSAANGNDKKRTSFSETGCRKFRRISEPY